MNASTLDAFLGFYCGSGEDRRKRVADVIRALTRAAIGVRGTINMGALAGSLAAELKSANAGGDAQRQLDIHADEAFLSALAQSPVAYYCSEELDTVTKVNAEGDLAIAIDPLDGSSNIDTNVSIGTIFSILPVPEGVAADPTSIFLQPGSSQIAAGFFIYGPQLALALTLGSGTHIFIFSQRLGTFVQAYESRIIPPRTSEFAINASNYRYWNEPVRLYFDDCLKGADGPRERDFNMRWVASLVAEAYRILIRGGVFLYPGDARKGYGQGRLRLVYEANPIAMLVEQAGGGATDGVSRILDLVPEDLHQKTPLIFGARREVDRIGRYHTEPSLIAERDPLFGRRGLFRA